MSGILFLGSSHVAAFKLAHTAIDPDNTLGCRFACARGADLAFTKVEEGVLQACDTADYDAETISYAFPGWMEAHYLIERRPTDDVCLQFLKTAGTETIDVSHCSRIFYVLGVSPYDFMRLNESIMPVSSALRRRLLGQMLADRHLLRHQIEAIRICNPDCLHYLIAMPLKAIVRPDPNDLELEVVSANRDIVARHAADHLFDGVFMPGLDLLDNSLLSTRVDFTAGGCAASEAFQKDPTPIETDRQHMNGAYGKAVFDAFVRSRLPFALP